MSNRFFLDSPARFALLSFSALILVGTLLLFLPMSRTQEIGFFDLLFTATSATCVTGLMTISLEQFTFFGLFIIMLLMQLGALGLSTIGLSLVYLLRSPGVSTHVFASHVLELNDWHSVQRLLIFILKTTFAVEIIGALCVFPFFYAKYQAFDAFFYSCFHVVSSFCNAGITYKTIQNEQYLVEFAHNIPFLSITLILILLGGLGFVTIQELLFACRRWIQRKSHTFSLNTKLVLITSFTITTLFTFSLFLVERNGVFASYSLLSALFQCLFHAISFKSCGFTTVAITDFHPVSLLLTMVSSFIGSAPGSTGSGVKVVAVALYLCSIRSVIIGRDSVELYNRTVPLMQVLKSIAIVSVTFVWIILTLFLLLTFEQHKPFLGLLFEASSAITNLGLSLLGVQFLSLSSRWILLLAMITGRIGPLALIASLRLSYETKGREFSYPEERVMLG